MLTLRSFSIGCLCVSAPALFLGCSVFKSKDKKAAERAVEAFRQESDAAEAAGRGTEVAGNTTGNPKWKPEIDEALTKARTSVPNNTASTNRSGPPPRNVDTNVKIDLDRAKATTYHSVNTGGNHIALTFDDGPHAVNTPRLLDMLKERNIKATFFVVATNAKRYPAIMQRIIAEGHEVGNHTVTHGNLSKMSNDQIRGELDGCRDAIINSCGVNPRVMRAQADPVGPHTDAAILESCDWAARIICAWGTHGAHLNRGPRVEALLRGLGLPLFQLGLTQAGHPTHPLYIPYDRQPVLWHSPTR